MRKILAIFILSILPIALYAETKSKIDLDVSKEVPSTKKLWDVGILYSQQTDHNEDDDIQLSGINFQLARTFHISDKFYTKSVVSSNFLNGSESLDEYDIEVDYDGLYFMQTISYLITNFKYKVQPFIGLGIGSGSYESENKLTNSQTRQDIGVNKISIDSRYNTTNTVLGVEVFLEKNFSVYTSYTMSNLSYSEVQSKVDKRMGDFDSVNVDVELEDISSSKLSLGVKYNF